MSQRVCSYLKVVYEVISAFCENREQEIRELTIQHPADLPEEFKTQPHCCTPAGIFVFHT